MGKFVPIRGVGRETGSERKKVGCEFFCLVIHHRSLIGFFLSFTIHASRVRADENFRISIF